VEASLKYIYSALSLIAPALVLPIFMFFKRGRDRCLERLGIWNCSFEECIWFHGASLGETIGLERIAAELRTELPKKIFFGTATSPTGLERSEKFCSESRLLTFDHPVYFAACVKSINPKVFVFGENEIWPNLLMHLKESNIPAILVNARISEGACRQYLQFHSIFAEAIKSLSHVFAADADSAKRLIKLGCDPQKVEVLSNTKYDLPQIDLPEASQRMNLKRSLFTEELPLIVFASLRPGEEDFAFSAIKIFQEQGGKANFLIAPRHREKFDFFESKLIDLKLEFAKHSRSSAATEKNIYFLDNQGELSNFLPAADLVFTGGTLVEDYGGHNPFEAAQYAVAPVIGPFYQGIAVEVAKLKQAKACFHVAKLQDIIDLFNLVQSDQLALAEKGKNAYKLCISLRGSSKIIATKILSLIQN
jgi:3-deoxy-D-manno-octulosonic-acid transferase